MSSTQRKWIVLAMIIEMLASCKSTGAGGGPAVPSINVLPAGAGEVEDTRVYVRNHCLLANSKAPEANKQFAPLLGILAPALIGKAIGGIASAFRKAGADQVDRRIAAAPVYLYERTADVPPALKIHKSLGCVILVYGAFDANAKESKPGKEPAAKFSDEGVFDKPSPEQDAKRLKRLTENEIPVRKVYFLTEIKIDLAEDNTAFLYTARFLWINKFLSDRSAPERGLVVNVNLVGAGPKPEEPTISAALLNYGDVKGLTISGPDSLRGVTSDWAGGIGIGKESKEAFSALASNKEVLNYMPVTLKAGYAETAKGNAIAKFIGEILEEKKTELTKLANEQISPVETAKADAKDAADLEALAVREEAAYAAFLTAKSNRAKDSPPPAASADENRARIGILDFEVTRTTRLWCNALKAYQTTATIPPKGRDTAHLAACI